MASSHKKIPENKQETLSVDKVLDDLIKHVFNLIPETLRSNKKLFDSLGGGPLLLAKIPSNEKYAADFLCAQYEALLIIRNEKILKITDIELTAKLLNPFNKYKSFFAALHEVEEKDKWGMLHPFIIDEKTFALGKALQVFADALLSLKKTNEAFDGLLKNYSTNSPSPLRYQIEIYEEIFSKQEKRTAKNSKPSDYMSYLHSQIHNLYQGNTELQKILMEKVDKLFKMDSQANAIKNKQDEKKQTQTQTGNSKMTAALAKPPMGLPPKKPIKTLQKNTANQDKNKNNKLAAATPTKPSRPVPPPPQQSSISNRIPTPSPISKKFK